MREASLTCNNGGRFDWTPLLQPLSIEFPRFIETERNKPVYRSSDCEIISLLVSLTIRPNWSLIGKSATLPISGEQPAETAAE